MKPTDFYWPFPWLPPGALLCWSRGTWDTRWQHRPRSIWDPKWPLTPRTETR